MNAQALLFTLLIRYSFPCMIPKLSNELLINITGTFGKYANHEGASGQIETDIHS